METLVAGKSRIAGAHLGNFLSGMETALSPARCSPRSTLETSLVEWKRGTNLDLALKVSTLGNFLSGMETHLPTRSYQRLAILGNFLSGMETRYGAALLVPYSLPWKLP